ncbi:MAG TPA: PIG-L family deacetylase [Micromonosporaceae bacterium]
MRTVAGLGTILGIWAHPDDEAYLSAGLMARARDLGNRVVVATATHGELGTADPDAWPRHRLAPVRARELQASLAVLGVREHRFLGFADGACAQVEPRAGIEAVQAVIEEVRPDTIVTFGPDGMTGHDDHVTVSQWTQAAWLATGASATLLHATLTTEWHERWRALNERVGLWMSGSGPVTALADLHLSVPCDALVGQRKIAALRAHASQTTPLIELVGEETFRDWWSQEHFAAVSPHGHDAPTRVRAA